MWKDITREYFRFSKRERAGILILALLILLTCWLPDLIFYCRRIPVADTTDLRLAVTAFEAQLAEEAVLVKDEAVPAAVLFAFDPNTIGVEGWRQLGVRARTAAIIQKFLLKGGHFRQPADLQKIYGLPPALCTRLIPYVRIAGSSRRDDRPFARDTLLRHSFTFRRDTLAYRHQAKMPAVMVDINLADTTGWQTLPGIGPGFARRIVAFRDKLGGFYEVAQVAEVYGLPDSTFQKIQPFLQIGNSSLKKIDLNLTDEKSLAAHPYIRYKLARLIVQYRNAHAGFRQADELRSLPLVDEIIYRKIEHYIEITF